MFITHGLFELGIATSVKTTRFLDAAPSGAWYKRAERLPLDEVFLHSVQHIYALNMYHTFWSQGWTTKLARQSREVLLPEIIRMVTYAWYTAYREAGL